MATKKQALDWALAPAPESKDHFTLKSEYDLFIGGKWVKPKSGKYFDTINPANEQKLARIAEANAADVDAAVKAARKAYDTVWSRMPAAERAKYIYRIARLLQEKARQFAVVESMDGGKAIRESRDVDVPLAAAHFFYYAGWADKLSPERHRAHWASPGRSSRGTSRCSWPRGRSRPRWPAATPWC